MVSNNGEQVFWVTKELITLEGFALLRCKTLESAKKLLSQAKVPIIMHNGSFVVHYNGALKLIEEYYDGFPPLPEDHPLVNFQVFWASKEFMDTFLQEHDFFEVDLIFEISEKKHTNWSDFFDSSVQKHKSPKEFFQWFQDQCAKFLISRRPS